MTRGTAGMLLLVLAVAGCSSGPGPAADPVPIVTRTQTVTVTAPVVLPSPTSSEPSSSSFTPDEDGFAAAVAKADPTWKWPSRQLLIDTGYNICSLKQTSPDLIDDLFANPKRRDVYVDAARAYLCP